MKCEISLDDYRKTVFFTLLISIIIGVSIAFSLMANYFGDAVLGIIGSIGIPIAVLLNLLLLNPIRQRFNDDNNLSIKKLKR